MQRLVHFGGDLRLEQLVQRRIILRVQRFERDVVLGEEPRRRRVDECCGRAAIHQRHRHVEARIDPAQLAEIGELVRSRDVTHGGEDRVLDDRPQQHARAERRRPFHGFPRERARGDRLVVDDEAAVASLDGSAAVRIDAEQRDAVSCGVCTCV